MKAERRTGSSSRSFPVSICVSQLCQLAAGWRRQAEAEGEREGLLQVTVVTASLSLVVFAHTNCVCFGPERNAAAPPSPYFSGYFCRTL